MADKKTKTRKKSTIAEAQKTCKVKVVSLNGFKKGAVIEMAVSTADACIKSGVVEAAK